MNYRLSKIELAKNPKIDCTLGEYEMCLGEKTYNSANLH